MKKILLCCLVLFVAFAACKEEQETLTLSVNKETMNLNAAAGSSDVFSITSNADWTVESDETWLTPSSKSGNGNKDITVTADANLNTGNRTATITVSIATEVPKTIVVTQFGTALSLAVTEKERSVADVETTFEVIVSTNIASAASITATPREKWIEKTATQVKKVSGGYSYEFTALQNTTVDTRSAYITFASGNLKDSVKIVQAGEGKLITVVTSIDTAMSELGGKFSVKVQSNLALKVRAVDWITPDNGASGQAQPVIAENTYHFAMLPNTVKAERSGAIVFYSDQDANIKDSIVVRQKAKTDDLFMLGSSTLPASAMIPQSGQSFTLTVFSTVSPMNIEVAIAAGSEWISKGANNGLSYSFTVGRYEGLETRIGTITFTEKNSGLMFTYNPMQAGDGRRQDSIALRALYDATDGANWKDRNGAPVSWDVNKPLEEWATTEFNQNSIRFEKGRVSQLGISNWSLSGTIPPAFWNLTEAAVITLQFQAAYAMGFPAMNGIPDEIVNCKKLRNLTLECKNYIGSIAAIAQVPSLVQITISNSGFNGTLPSDMSKLTQATALFLQGNALTGTIPATISDMPLLSMMELQNNALSGPLPEELANIRRLSYLNLSGNKITGSLPSGIFNISTIVSVNISNNQLTGKIPVAAGTANNLTTILLSNNQLNDTIPAKLFNTTKVAVIDLSNNQLTGSIPANIGLGSTNTLTTFIAHNNKLSGEIPKELGKYTRLARLQLSNNNLTGTLPVELKALAVISKYDAPAGTSPTSGTYADFRNNRLSGAISDDLRDAKNTATPPVATFKYWKVCPQQASFGLTNVGDNESCVAP